MPPADGASSRRLLVGWFLVTTVAVVGAIVVTTPWQWLPGGQLPPIDPTGGLSPAQLQRISAFRSQAVPLRLLTISVPLGLAALLGFTSRGARLVRRLPGAGRWWAQTLLAVALLLLLSRLVTLAFEIRAEQVSRSVGLSTQPWSGWAGDQLKSYAVSVVTVAVPMLVVVALWRRTRHWWFPASLVAAGLVVVASFGYPLVVEPLFARFTSMPASPLRASLLTLAERDEVPVSDVLVADASHRTTALNAYVSGFGASRRIVVYDTLLQQATPAEVRLVVAHELGHAKADDVLRGTLIGALGAAAAIPALALVLETAGMRRTAGYGGSRDAAVVPAVLAVVALGSFVLSPVPNLISRAVEARADLHALDLTRDPATFVAAQRRLAVANLSSPDPARVLYLWYATHPTVSQRIALARGWAELNGS